MSKIKKFSTKLKLINVYKKVHKIWKIEISLKRYKEKIFKIYYRYTK